MPTTIDRWEAIARLRCTVRDERREALAACLQLEATLREELVRLESGLREWQAEARSALAGAVDLRRLQNARAGMAALNRQYQQIQAQLTAATAEVYAARQSLLTADQEVKVLERLQEKQQTVEQAQQQRQETALLDEIAQA